MFTSHEMLDAVAANVQTVCVCTCVCDGGGVFIKVGRWKIAFRMCVFIY